ncbi:hypothetical protein [Streptomyces mirabilis]|uniref:hypothetical protein n=1 Tax=Streptomyces mirabilis TaxID=68239 RepID=UPI003691DCF1
MIRPVRVLLLPVVLLFPLLLAGCGTQKAGAGTGVDSSASVAVPSRAELDARVSALGIAPELVYVTKAPGFTLAQQSVGVYGDDGFSGVYWAQETNAQIQLSVERGTMTARSCPKQPVGGMAGERTVCERGGDAWYRVGGGRHEYALVEKGHVLKVSGDSTKVTRAVLRSALHSAHRPSDAELAAVLPPARTATAPVERGDLPSTGDGAPDNEVGTSG